MADIARNFAHMAKGTAAGQMYPEPATLVRPATILEGLQSRKERLTRELASVDETISALQANPEVERVLNLLGEINRY